MQLTPKHTYTLDPMKLESADYAAVGVQCGNLSRNELTYNLPGNIWPLSSQLTQPLWADPGIKRGLGESKLISTKRECRQGMDG